VAEHNRERITATAKTILKLDEDGRRYLAEDRSKEPGVALLVAVSVDLGGIFLLLLENASLCGRDGCRRAFAAAALERTTKPTSSPVAASSPPTKRSRL